MGEDSLPDITKEAGEPDVGGLILAAIKKENIVFPYYEEPISEKLYHLHRKACAKIKEAEGRPPTKEEKTDLLGIATSGTLDGHELTIADLPYWNWSKPFDLRYTLIALYGVNKEFARSIVKNEIIGTHGSSLASLPDVLAHGLLPQSKTRKLQILITGEMFGNAGISENHVAFTQWDEIKHSLRYIANGNPLTRKHLLKRRKDLNAINKDGNEHWKRITSIEVAQIDAILDLYSQSRKTQTEEEKMALLIQNHPLVYFLRNDMSLRSKTNFISHTDNTDFYVRNGVKTEGLPMICVRRESIPKAREIIDRTDISMAVFPIEDWIEAGQILNPGIYP